ncbi:hypothetical protein [Mycetocola sp. 2940]|uniref:hypothetical protein n=1 Tax=Mycetocola sp. 2940 TaxID=3156452 RepID=UPI0033990755
MRSNVSPGWSWLSRLFRRSPYLPPFRPDPQPLAPFEQALDEGLLIARHGVTLAVRNRLIVRALKENEAFDDAATARIVDEELQRAAEEQRENAEGAQALHAVAGRSGGIADHAHDYHRIDTATLERRERLYLALEESLEASRNDPDFIAAMSERARDDAWKDIGDNVVSRLNQSMVSAADEPDYVLYRPDRIRQLLEVDLASLLPREDPDASDR